MEKPVLSDKNIKQLKVAYEFFSKFSSLKTGLVSPQSDFEPKLKKLVLKQTELHEFPMPDPSEQTLDFIITRLIDGNIYGAAFAVSILNMCWENPLTYEEEHLNVSFYLRKRVQEDMKKHKNELEGFEECFEGNEYGFQSFTSEMVLPMLEFLLDEYSLCRKKTPIGVAVEKLWDTTLRYLNEDFNISNGNYTNFDNRNPNSLFSFSLHRH